ncbi:MAG: hypothetical protein RLZZ347_525 [Candidatus Parcubacteria bacterium]|jgi:nicotinamidase-related amidase
MQNVHLLIIDPQVDFMDSKGSALPVTGANDDMCRLAGMVRRVGHKLADVHVTMDSHHVVDVAHPGMWENQKGQNPAPFTMITPDDLETGIWRPRNQHCKPPQLGGQTLGQYMLGYTRALAKGGKYPLMVWPEHCLIGTSGHRVQDELMGALVEWERKYFATIDFVTKGTSPYTEHFGALMAEVPMATDPSTGLNTAFLSVLAQADIVAVAGEALSHCVLETVSQIADNIGAEHIKKFHILTDCTSPVPQPPGGPDFPAIAKAWLKKMEGRGMTLTTSGKFLA